MPAKTVDHEIFEYPNGLALPPVHPGLTLAAELAARGVGDGGARRDYRAGSGDGLSRRRMRQLRRFRAAACTRA